MEYCVVSVGKGERNELCFKTLRMIVILNMLM
jgi:hypothetical protein